MVQDVSALKGDVSQAPGLTLIHVDTVFKVGRALRDAWTLQQTLEITRCPFPARGAGGTKQEGLAWGAPCPRTWDPARFSMAPQRHGNQR